MRLHEFREDPVFKNLIFVIGLTQNHFHPLFFMQRKNDSQINAKICRDIRLGCIISRLNSSQLTRPAISIYLAKVRRLYHTSLVGLKAVQLPTLEASSSPSRSTGLLGNFGLLCSPSPFAAPATEAGLELVPPRLG